MIVWLPIPGRKVRLYCSESVEFPGRLPESVTESAHKPWDYGDGYCQELWRKL